MTLTWWVLYGLLLGRIISLSSYKIFKIFCVFDNFSYWSCLKLSETSGKFHGCFWKLQSKMLDTETSILRGESKLIWAYDLRVVWFFDLENVTCVFFSRVAWNWLKLRILWYWAILGLWKFDLKVCSKPAVDLRNVWSSKIVKSLFSFCRKRFKHQYGHTVSVHTIVRC